MDNINSFDLLLIDYHLDDDMSGNHVVEAIRMKNCLTPVVFYSNSPTKEIRSKITELELDGVYCSTRNGFPELVKQIMNISLRKVEDINYLRGLVLATTSDLENSLNVALLKIFNQLDSEQCDKFISYVAENICQSAFDKNTDKLIALRNRELEFSELVEKHFFYDMSKKTFTLNHCLKEAPYKQNQTIKEKREILNIFMAEIIDIRNSLAHVVEDIDEDGNRFLKGAGIVFDENKYIEIRNNLRKHKINLEELIEIL